MLQLRLGMATWEKHAFPDFTSKQWYLQAAVRLGNRQHYHSGHMPMESEASRLACQYIKCKELFRKAQTYDGDFQLWGGEFHIAEGQLDRKLRRSKSLERLVYSNLESLEVALEEYITSQQNGHGEEHQLEARRLVSAEVHGLLCWSPELRDPPPSDNIKLLNKVDLSSAALMLETERVSREFPSAAEQLRRRMGVLNWIRRKQVEDRILAQPNIAERPVFAVPNQATSEM